MYSYRGMLQLDSSRACSGVSGGPQYEGRHRGGKARFRGSGGEPRKADFDSYFVVFFFTGGLRTGAAENALSGNPLIDSFGSSIVSVIM